MTHLRVIYVSSDERPREFTFYSIFASVSFLAAYIKESKDGRSSQIKVTWR